MKISLLFYSLSKNDPSGRFYEAFKQGSSLVKKSVQKILLFFLFTGIFQQAFADGSVNLYPAGVSGNRASLYSTNNSVVNAGSFPFKTRGTQYVYVRAGEYITAGSSAVGISRPKTDRNDPNVPTPAAIIFTSPTGAVLSTTTEGLIANRTQELGGPMSPLVTGVAGKFKPYSYLVKPGEEGVWRVDMDSPASPVNDASPQAGSFSAVDNWTQANNISFIAAWDVSVWSTTAPGDGFIHGRVYANILNLGLNGGFGKDQSYFGVTYVLTKDGRAYRVNNNGNNGFGFAFFANNKGFIDAATGNSTFKSLDVPSPVTKVQDPRIQDDAARNLITHKLFYTKPAPDLPLLDQNVVLSNGIDGSTGVKTTTWLKKDAIVPTVTEVSFVGAEGTPGQASQKGGFVIFTANVPGSYRVTIPISGGTDRVLTGSADAGVNRIKWDGRDGSGAIIPGKVLNPIVKVRLTSAEVHFPFIDMEINPQGFIIELTENKPDNSYTINNTSLDESVYSDRVYWDDSDIRPLNSTTGGPAPDPIVNTINGISSRQNGHKWGTYGNGAGFGDAKSLDTYAYILSNEASVPLNVTIKVADLQIESIASNIQTVAVGGNVTFTVKVKNSAGSSDIVGSKFNFNVPSGFVIKTVTSSSSCATESGAVNSGANYQSTLDLTGGCEIVYTITGTVDATLKGQPIPVTASILRPNDVTDPDATNTVFDQRPASAQVECDAAKAVTGTNCNNILINSQASVANPLGTVTGGQVVCEGTAPVVITFTGSNSSPAYTFYYTINGTPQTPELSGPAGNAVVNQPTIPGTYVYNLTAVSDGNSSYQNPQSGTTATTTVTVNPLSTASISGSTAVCQNSAAVPVTFTGTGGTAPYTFTYTLNNGAAQQVTSDASGQYVFSQATNVPGDFQYVITNISGQNGCPNVQSASSTVTVNSLPTASVSAITPVCQNGAAVPVTFTGTGGVAPYTFTYTVNGGDVQEAGSDDSGQFLLFQDTSVPGDFKYVITGISDQNSCTNVQSVSTTVTVRPLSIASVSASTSVCQNGATVPVTFTGTGGVAPYRFTYTMNGGTAKQVVSNASGQFVLSQVTNVPGEYKYTITAISDQNGCPHMQLVSSTVTVNPLPTAGISGTSPVCASGTPAVITFTGLGGTAPYTFTYTMNGGAAQMISTIGTSDHIDLPQATDIPGDYKYVITSVSDKNTCSNVQSASRTITVNPLSTASISASTAVCQNSAAVPVTFTGTGGTAPYTFTYTVNGGAAQVISTIGTSDHINVFQDTDVPGDFQYVITNISGSNGCANVQSASSTVTVHPTPTVSPVADITLCNTAPQAIITFGSPVAGTTYHWTKDGNDIGLSVSSGDGNVPAFTAVNNTTSPISSIFTVTPTANGCEGTPLTFRITVNPTATVSPVADITLCNTAQQAVITFSSPVTGTTYHWTNDGNDIGLSVSSGDGNVPAFTAVNNTTAPISSIFTVTPTANGCEGTPLTFRITVNPTATVSPAADITLCNNAQQAIITFGSPVTGTTYHWTKDGNDIGLSVSSGDGNVPAFTAVNNTTSPISSIFTVTPTANGCEGTPLTFKITVNPTVTVSPVADITLCNTAPQAVITFGSPVAGTTYHWTKDGNDIGLSVSSGDGNVPAFTAVNNTTAPISSVFTVTPTANGCEGTPLTFKITVNPTATVSPVADITLCNTAPQAIITFGSPVTGTTYHWTKDGNDIGLSVSSGDGNVPAFTAVNNTNAPISSIFTVTPTANGCEGTPLTFRITVNPTATVSPIADITLCNTASQAVITFGSPVAGTTYHWTKDGNDIGLAVSSGDGNVPAFTAVNNTTSPISSIFTVTPTANGCEGTPLTFKITVNPTATVSPVADITLCNTAPQAIITFGSPVAGTTYHWTKDGNDIGLSVSSGDGNVPAFTAVNNTNAPISSIFTVTPTANGCEGTPLTFKITVNPTATVSPVADITLCNTAQQAVITFGSPVTGTTYHWTKDGNDIGLSVSSGDGNVPAFTAVNNTTAPISSIFTVTPTANGCEGTPLTFKITVNPTVTVSPIADITLCNTAQQAIITFGSPVTGTTYHWTKDGTDIGLPVSSGTGNLPAFTAVNTTNEPISSVFTVTPTANGCESTPLIFKITVNPTATVSPIADITLCNTASQAIITFGSPVAGTTYHWTKDGNDIGLSVSSGDGNVPAFTAVNNTNAPVSSIFTVTPTANGCEGTPLTFRITVNPTATVSPVADITLCNTAQQAVITFGSPVAGTTYHWTKDGNDIGLSVSSGDGNVPAFTAVNNTNAPISSIFTVTPTANGCEGTPLTFRITVNPTATVSPVADITLCNTASQAMITFGGPVTGTTYHWTKDGNDIGLAVSSGDGNVPAFTAVNNTTAPISSVFTVTPTANGCEGTPLTFKITVNPTATVSPIADITLCNTAPQAMITFGSPVAGATYHWTKDGNDIGLSVSSGDGNVPAFTAVNNTTAPVSSVFTVTPTANGCEGTPLTFRITVNPTATVSPVADITLCNTASQAVITFGSPVTGTTYHWTKDGNDIGLAQGSGDGNVPAFTAVNNTTAPVSSVFTVTPTANGCEGTPLTFKITVNPTATVSPVADITLCNTAPQAVITFGSPVTGTTYHWTKDGNDIGLSVSSGDNSIPGFTAVNNTTAPVSSVFTVTPTANGCEGTPLTFKITVNPTATVSPIADITLCNTAPQAIITFGSPVAGTTYHWTKDGNDIGLAQGSGDGNVPAFTAVNNTTAPISSVFTVTPTANGCEGTPLTFKITVNPTATVLPVADIMLCNTAQQAIITFGSPVAGTTYHWTKDGNDIGLSVSSGDGNVPAFTAVNNTNAPISSVFTVTPTANGCEGTPLTFRITVNPTATISPVADITLCNTAPQAIITFGSPVAGATYHWTKDGNDIGLSVSSGDGNVPAFTAVNNTTAPISSVFTVTPTANGCEGTPLTFKITVNPTATVLPVADITLCNTAPQAIITFGSPVAGTTYHWTKDGNDIGLAQGSGDNSIPAFTAVNNTTAPVSSVFTVTPTANGCEGTPLTFKITVNPTATVSPIADITLCNTAPQAIITFGSPVAGTTYHWTKDGNDIGLAQGSGDGNVPAFTAVNNTTAPVSSIFTVTPTANGCEGTPLTFKITVNPTATVLPVADITLCNTAPQAIITFGSPVAGTTYHWTKDGNNIGLAQGSGDGNVPAFTAVNNTTAPVSSVFTVTPTANGCEGTPLTFKITVNPTATVLPVADIALCNTAPQAVITFGSPVTGTTYHWTKDGNDIGLAQGSGDGNVPAFTAVNNTTAPVSSVFTVTPTANGCEGTPLTFKITVNPTATVLPVADITLCNTAPQAIITFGSPVAGATYHWTKDGNDIGLAVSSGDGNVPAFTAVNNTTAPVSSVFTVTPTANGCEGTPLTFKITVNPTATVLPVADITLCNTASQAVITFGSPVTGTTYHWTKDGNDIGLAQGSGDGNVPAFTAVNNTNASVSSIFTITPTANGCEGTPLTFKITVNPTATVLPVADITLCNTVQQAVITFGSPVAGTTYHWTKDSNDIGLAQGSGDGNVPAFTAVNNTNAPVSSVFTVTPTANGCEGTPLTFKITVNPTATVLPMADITLCNTASQAVITFGSPVTGTTYHWTKDGNDIGLAQGSGDGNVPAFTAVNNTNAPVSSIFTITPTANGCEGTPLTFKITVNPTATVLPVADITLCNTAPQAIITFGSPVAGATYHWTKDGNDIGLAVSSGDGNVPAFTAVNNTTAPVSSVFTVTPTANGCEGTPLTFKITVNPTATVMPVADITLCNTAQQAIITFGSPVAGTTYHWTKDGNDIGLAQASGDNSIPAFTAVNNTNAPVSSVFTVTPTANGCEGTPLTFKITVNPTATVLPVADITLCNTAPQAIITFGSPVAGTTYHWTKDGNDIGLAQGSGDGNVPAFTAVNNTTAPVSSIFTVTPTANGCEGTPLTFKITVNPTATVSPVADITLCNTAPQAIITFGSPVSGTTYHWTKDGNDIGLAQGSGDNSIPAFIAVNNTNAPISSVFTVTPTANGCEGTPLTFKITVNPTATVLPKADITLCNTAPQGIITFGSPVAGTTYHWTKDGNDIGLAQASGDNSIPAFTAVNNTNAPVSSVFTVTPTANGCEGTPLTFKITVNPTATVLPVADITLCNTAPQGIFTFGSPVAGTTYHWTKDGNDIGLSVSSGDNSIPAFTAINNTTAPVSSVFTVTPTANGCEGTPLTFKITVNPTATVLPVADITLCNTAPQAITTFGSPVSGTTYHWTKDGNDIGLSFSSGDNSIPAFTAINNTNAPVSSVFTVTPTANGCEGTPLTFKITVNPTATVLPVADITLCNTAPQAMITFGSPVAGTTYHWTKDGNDIGLAQVSGDNSIPAFTAINNTNAPVSSVFTVTPTANGCEGTPLTFKITVNPTATVSPVADITLCNTASQAVITFGSPVAGTTYHWTKDGNDIGLSFSSGDNSIPAFTAINNTNAPVSSVFTVTPTANGCEGTPLTFRITVNPTARVLPVADITLCNTAPQAVITFSSPVAGTTYHWTKDGNDIGIAQASGDNSIPAFTAVNNTTAPVSSVFTVTPKANGCEGVPVTFTITVNPDATIRLTSAIPTAAQTVCVNNDITAVTYQTTNATRVETSGLPNGVTGTFANGVFTISGAPSDPGTFHYTVTAISSCRVAQLSGTVTVNPRPAGYNDVISNLSCGNTTISYNLQDNVNNTANGGNSVPSTFTWTAAPNNNVTGITNGSGNVISTTLYNLSQSVQQVIYTVTPTSALGGCPGQTFTVTVNVPVCSQITITKTADVSVISKAGDLIRYTITVKNIATANHTGVKVTDPFLGGVLTGPTSGDNGNGILEANESWIYTGTYLVTQADIDNNGKPNAGTGKIINTATVNTIEQPVPLSASSSVDIVTTGDITLVKIGTISRDFSTVTYTFTVTNTGKVRLHDLNLMDPKTGGQINLNPDVLDAGASVSATVVYTVTDAEKRDGRVSNTATVKGITPAGDIVTDISGTQANNDDPTVNIIDDAPQAINDNASTMINQPVTFSLTDNDLPSFNGLDRGSIIIVKFPTNGIVQVNPDGTVTYTPNRGYSGPDSFTYTVTDLKGKISNKALVSITVIPIDLFIPNTFTPNGDGKNDTFRIIGRESFDSIDLLIFNRWGNEVFRRSNYLDDWDGSGLNEGTYYYLITLKKGGNEIVKKGWILLKR